MAKPTSYKDRDGVLHPATDEHREQCALCQHREATDAPMVMTPEEFAGHNEAMRVLKEQLRPFASALDDKPSIAELQRDSGRIVAQESGWTYSRDRIEAAAPVLLEIAAAALAYHSPASDEAGGIAWAALEAALAKIRT